MGGCGGGSCGCGGGVTWTRERLDQLWQGVRDTLASGASPSGLLAQSFQAGVDATKLDDESAELVARLWLVWGVVEAADALVAPAPKRRDGLKRATCLLEDALRCAPSAETAASLHYNLGAALLVSSLEPTPASAGPDAAAPPTAGPDAAWTPRSDPSPQPAWDAAAQALTQVVDAAGASPELREAAGRLVGLAWCLSGVTGRDQRVRARLLALHNARAVLPEGDPVRAIAESAEARLGALGAMTRLMGRHDTPLPEEARLLPVRLGPLLRLPPELLAAGEADEAGDLAGTEAEGALRASA